MLTMLGETEKLSGGQMYFYKPEWVERDLLEDGILCWAWTLPKKTALTNGELVRAYNDFADRIGAPHAPSSNILTRTLTALGAHRWHTATERGIRTPGHQMVKVLRGPVTGRVCHLMSDMARGTWTHAEIRKAWEEEIIVTRGPMASVLWVEMVMVYMGARPVPDGLVVGSTMPAEV
jgi:hypothetical protein